MNNRLQPNCKPQKSLIHLAIRGMITVTLGSVTVACSEGVISTPQPDTLVLTTQLKTIPAAAKDATSIAMATSNTEQVAPDSGTYYAEFGNDGEPDEPLSANIERLDLQPGISYSEVRSLVMAEGWVPYTQAEGANPDINTLTVLEMHKLGFEEAQSCSGTGQGFCSFEFVHINREAFPEVQLIIITTPAIGELYGEPNYNNWRIDNYEPEVSSFIKGDNPNYAFLEADATYQTQKLDAALYADVLAQEQDCVLFGDCAYSQYLFEDVLLRFSTGEFGSTMMTIIPHVSVSRTQALNYAQMLDIDGEIDFTDSILVSNNEGETPPEAVRITESFFEADLNTEGSADDRGPRKMVRLISKPGDDISRIEFEIFASQP